MGINRMRVFAGPNGSGKSTSLLGLFTAKKINLGVYVNADEIEKELKTNLGKLELEPFKVILSNEELVEFIKKSEFSPVKRKEPALWTKVSIINNTIVCTTHIDSYLAADLAEFLRQQLLKNNISFTYETVLSHGGKIDFMADARRKGFKVYLYFVATEDPEINVSRVGVRVSEQGHGVPEQIIKSRYLRSLKNLKSAVENSDIAFIFDNSGSDLMFVGSVANGKEVKLENPKYVPEWADAYLFNN